MSFTEFFGFGPVKQQNSPSFWVQLRHFKVDDNQMNRNNFESTAVLINANTTVRDLKIAAAEAFEIDPASIRHISCPERAVVFCRDEARLGQFNLYSRVVVALVSG
jgi:hypothetical protein